MASAALLDRQFLEKLERLTIHWEKSFAGLVGGHNSSHFAGGGQEFLDHRHFHHGDDLRAVNWRAYMRLEKLFLKMFQVEPRVPVRLLLDTSASMLAHGGLKFDYARKLAGALCYVDAVQFAPHGPIDVRALGCDFLACSAYKFFGPHVGALYGRYELLDDLRAYKVRPAPSDPPGKFETGTGNFEGYAGTLGALEYLEWVGETFGGPFAKEHSGRFRGRALKLKQAMSAIREYEKELSQALLDVLEETPGVTIHGITDRRRLAERVPTVSFTLKGHHPHQVAEALGQAGLYVWDGNYYALAVTERLGLEESGGMVRVGPAHYNTLAEMKIRSLFKHPPHLSAIE